MVQTRFRRATLIGASLVTTIALLGACGKPAEKAEDVRPVRAILLDPQKISVIAEFPGEVRARVESRLGFRVPGKIVARKVDVGASVKRGQVLMQLDPQDLRLAQEQADAALRSAKSSLAFAQADFARYQELRAKNFVSAAVLQSKELAFQSAQAGHEQALAAARNQSNQAGYANLVSDADGIVTAVDAEVGQVVAAGTPILRVAKQGDKEVVIGIPEDKVDVLRNITDLQVTFWSDREYKAKGKLRELSPVADPATRTYLARVSIPDAAQQIRLGMSATVAFIAANPQLVLKLPLSALLNEKGETAVWVVEHGVVKLVPVQIATVSGNDVVVSSGVAAGQTVVTAGVNLLKPGQKVKLLGAEPAGATNVPGASAASPPPTVPGTGSAGAAK